MIIGIPKERRDNEARVAAVPETIKKLIGMGFEVVVEADAGAGALIPDDAFVAAGAKLVGRDEALGAALVFKVRPPDDDIAALTKGACVISLMEPYSDADTAQKLTAAGVVGFALELVPRITRAQSMDVLSSQANLAGYRAVLEAAYVFGRAFL